MADVCVTPGMTPTAGQVQTPGHTTLLEKAKQDANWFLRLIRSDKPEDPKRFGIVVASIALATGSTLCTLTLDLLAWLHPEKDLPAGLMSYAVSLAGFLAALAGVTHFKHDDPLPPGGGQ